MSPRRGSLFKIHSFNFASSISPLPTQQPREGSEARKAVAEANVKIEGSRGQEADAVDVNCLGCTATGDRSLLVDTEGVRKIFVACNATVARSKTKRLKCCWHFSLQSIELRAAPKYGIMCGGVGGAEGRCPCSAGGSFLCEIGDKTVRGGKKLLLGTFTTKL